VLGLLPLALAAPGAGRPVTALGLGASADADLARNILADPHYQSRLTGTADWSWSLPSGSFRLPFLSIAVPAWVPLVAIAVLVVAVAVPWMRHLARPDDAVETPHDGPAPAAKGDRSLERARALAEAGQHLEAVHLLLLVAVDHWSATAAGAGIADKTSREVLRGLPDSLPSERREAFATLVRAVEWSWFGGRPTGRSEYEQALRCCRDFLGGAA